jgi:hypothetical protein
MKSFISSSLGIVKVLLMDTSPSKDDYLKLIGDIAVQTSLLEMSIKNYIGRMNSNDRGANLRITAGMGLNELVTLYKSLFLYRVTEDTFIERCKKLCSHITNTVNYQRNEYIHSEWFLDEFEGKLLVQRTKVEKKNKKGFKFIFKQNEFEDLKKCLAEIESASINLILLMDDVMPVIKKHIKKFKNISSIAFNDEGFQIQ